MTQHGMCSFTCAVSPALLQCSQPADNHLQSPLGHSPNRPAISAPVYLMKTGNHHTPTALSGAQLTWDLAVFKDELTGIRASHPQLVELLGCAETWHSLPSQAVKTHLRSQL